MIFLTLQRDSAKSTVSFTGTDLPPYWAWLETDGAAGKGQLEAERPVYAYSVIPGGARNGKELNLALSRDPVAAAHYSGFEVKAARPIRLARARKAYVSYRLGEHIFWTSKRVTLHAGETLLTDGMRLVRGRCGNRISDLPAVPTSDREPPDAVLNAPVFPLTAAETADVPAPPPTWTEKPTPILLALGPPTGPASGSGPFLPPLPFVPCCGGSGPRPPAVTPLPAPAPPPVIPQPGPGPTSNPPPGPPPPAVPPVATPEPQTIELLLVGIAGLLGWKKSRRE